MSNNLKHFVQTISTVPTYNMKERNKRHGVYCIGSDLYCILTPSDCVALDCDARHAGKLWGREMSSQQENEIWKVLKTKLTQQELINLKRFVLREFWG